MTGQDRSQAGRQPISLLTKGPEMCKLNSLVALLLAVLVCAPSGGLADEPANVVRKIRVVRSGENLGVEITADRDIVYSCSKMPSLLRVIVDLPRTEPGQPDTVYTVDSPMISSIRIEKKTINEVMVTRVSINLGENADFAPLISPADKNKLTIFLRKAPPVQPAASAASATVQSVVEKQPTTGLPSTPPAPPASTAAAPRPMEKPAGPEPTRPLFVKGVSIGADAIDIQANGSVRDFRAFTLRQPGRLVIDIPAASSAVRTITAPDNRFGIKTARIGRFEGKLRLVFDTGGKPFPAYRATAIDSGLLIEPAKP